MRAHLFEQAPVQHRHPAAAAGRAARVGALPRLEHEAPGGARGIDAAEFALQRLHRRDDLALQRLEPVLHAL